METAGETVGDHEDVVPAGYAEAPGDCDEENALVFPGATEDAT